MPYVPKQWQGYSAINACWSRSARSNKCRCNNAQIRCISWHAGLANQIDGLPAPGGRGSFRCTIRHTPGRGSLNGETVNLGTSFHKTFTIGGTRTAFYQVQAAGINIHAVGEHTGFERRNKRYKIKGIDAASPFITQANSSNKVGMRGLALLRDPHNEITYR